MALLEPEGTAAGPRIVEVCALHARVDILWPPSNLRAQRQELVSSSSALLETANTVALVMRHRAQHQHHIVGAAFTLSLVRLPTNLVRSTSVDRTSGTFLKWTAYARQCRSRMKYFWQSSLEDSSANAVCFVGTSMRHHRR